tara:strand:- start:50341 stop:51369 length:1029 start_codon:yes stop_codon:yes gene_type:complete
MQHIGRLMSNWIKKHLRGIAFATASVEKDVIKQTSEEIKASGGVYQRHNQGSLADNLKQGEITTEVEDLRWRLYKVLDASDGNIIKIKGYTDMNLPIYDYSVSQNVKNQLKKVKVDDPDDYPLEMVVKNDSETLGWLGMLDNEATDVYDQKEIIHHSGVVFNNDTDDYDDDEEIVVVEEAIATHGNLTNDNYHSAIKEDKPIKITRGHRPKFEIEKYTKKLNVRDAGGKFKLLEFYVSKYPDTYNKKSGLFLSDIKKTLINPKFSGMLEIDEVSFITYKVLGSNDFREFNYRIKEFNKITEFDGYYIIKFLAEVTVNGEYLLEKYRMSDLEARYDNKEAKKQ